VGESCVYEGQESGNAVGVLIVPAKPYFEPVQIFVIL